MKKISKLGIFLGVCYLFLGIQIIYTTYAPTSIPFDQARGFVLIFYTLPWSMLFIKAPSIVEKFLYFLSILVNTGVVYIFGYAIGSILRSIFKLKN